MVSDAFFEYDYAAQRLIISTPHAGEDGEAELKSYFLGGTEEIDPFIGSFVDFVRQSEDGMHEKQLPRDNGQLHWLRVATRTIHDDHGKRAYTVGRISDIEEERRAQQELLEKPSGTASPACSTPPPAGSAARSFWPACGAGTGTR